MITGAILSFFLAIINFFVSILPDSTGLPVAVTSGITTVWGYVQAFSFLVPTSALIACLTIALTFHVTILGFKLFHWVIGKLRGSH